MYSISGGVEMKCTSCNQDIIIHDNLLPKRVSRKLTMEDITIKGMIYTVDGLREYSNSQFCQVCMDEAELNRSELKSYRLRIVK